MDTAELKKVIESLVFVSESPLAAQRISEVLDLPKERVLQALAELVREYAGSGRGFILQETAEGFQFRTRREYAEWIRRLHKSRPFKFSRAALESLAIIAYRQPIIRAEIDYLRGVDSGGVLKTLLEKRLIRILGKKDVPGRPLMYGTTREFLEVFGLRDLTDLPALKEFSELDLEAQMAEASSEAPAASLDPSI